MARALQAALLAAALARGSAYVYHLKHNTGATSANGDDLGTQAALVLSEVNGAAARVHCSERPWRRG
jgi:hypothetical protein